MSHQIPRERLRRYEAAQEECTVARLQVAANLAQDDLQLLMAAGQIELAAGAATHMLWCILMRAVLPAGSDSASATSDVVIKECSASVLEELDLPIAAAMIRAAALHDRERLTRKTR